MTNPFLYIILWFLNLLYSISFQVGSVLFRRKSNPEKEIKEKMDNAKNYQEWLQYALELDHLQGFDKWKRLNESPYYDVAFIQHKIMKLKTNDTEDLINELREGLLRSIAGIGNPKLYAANVGTKNQIEEYIDLVVEKLKFLCDTEFDPHVFSMEKKFSFFYETRQSFGRSSLLLSGGASLGMYHLGVIKTLYEEGLLPRVISGSSVGSIMAAIVGISSNEELEILLDTKKSRLSLECFDKLDNSSWFHPLKRRLFRLLNKGVLMDIKILEACVRENLGDYTFKEAYDKTGRILNISVASTQDFEFNRLLNYLTAPNVLIWSAAVASCALKFLYAPVELLSKDRKGNIVPYHPSGLKWSDGSVGTDLPMKRLSELFNVNCFIVSQVNPHMVPYLNVKYFLQKKHPLLQRAWFVVWDEMKHRFIQLSELGLIPAYFRRLVTVVAQKYEGDITVVPQFSAQDYRTLLSNPSMQIIEACMDKGSRATWPKVARIRNQLKIELTLEQCVFKLRKKLYPDGIFPKWNKFE